MKSCLVIITDFPSTRFIIPIVQALNKAGSPVSILILSDRGKTGSKSYQNITAKKFENLATRFELEIKSTREVDREKIRVDAREIHDLIFSIHSNDVLIDKAPWLNIEARDRWVSIFHGPDWIFEYLRIRQYDLKKQYSRKEIVLIPSEAWVVYIKKYLKLKGIEIDKFLNKFQIEYVGNLEYLLVGGSCFDNQVAKLGIKKVIYFSYPFDRERRSGGRRDEVRMFGLSNIIFNFFRNDWSWSGGYRVLCDILCSFLPPRFTKNQRLVEPVVIRLLRDFCDMHNLELVVKARKKFPVSRDVLIRADRVLYGEEDIALTDELLSSGALSLGYSSYAGINSLMRGNFHLNIDVSELCWSSDAMLWFDPLDFGPFRLDQRGFTVFSRAGLSETLRKLKVEGPIGKSELHREYVRTYNSFDIRDSRRRLEELCKRLWHQE